jgi:hypothetical protein
VAEKDPAIAELAGQLDALDASLKKVDVDATKAKASIGDLGRTAGTAVDPQVHALAQHLVGLDYDLVAVSLHAPKAATAVEEVGRKTATSTSQTKNFQDSLKDAAITFNEVRAAASTVASAVEAFATRVAALSTEQASLSRLQQRLHLDFDQAAAAAGRFSDETEAMGAAGRFASADMLLTQRQLDALTRVAGAASQELGITTAQAIEQLSEGLISGSERGLRPYGAALANVAGGSHTVAERLDALVARARQVTPATDDATDALNRFKDAIEDGQRTMATAFVAELARLSQVTAETRAASDATESWTEHLTELGQTAAFVASFIVSSFQLAAAAIQSTAGSISASIQNTIDLATHPLQAGSDAMNARIAARTDAGSAAFREAFRSHEALTLAAMGQRSSAAVPGERTAYTANGLRVTQGAADMTFTAEDVANEERSQQALRRRQSSGGSDSAAQAARDARLAAEFSNQRAPVSSDWASAFLAELHRQAGNDLSARGGTLGTQAEGIDLQRRSREAQIGVGRGREGDFDPTSSSGQDQARRERITVLREQREALAALLTTAEHEEQLARMSGASQSEVNDLMRQRIGIQTALAQSTSELSAATAENTRGLTEFKDKMGEAATGMVDGFAAAAVAALDGSKSFDVAMKEMLRSSLKSVAQMAIVEALKNYALAIGHLAAFNYPGAANAALAGAAWTGVAIAAGGAIAATNSWDQKAKSGAGGSASSSTSSARTDTGQARTDRSAGGPLQLNINVSGAIFETRHEVLQGIARGMTDAVHHGYLAPGALGAVQ